MGGGHDHGMSAAGANRSRLLTVLPMTSRPGRGGCRWAARWRCWPTPDTCSPTWLGLAVLAITFAAKAPTVQRTYGYFRLEILAAVVNGMLLFGVAALVLVEALRRFSAPPDVASGKMLVFAAVGLVANLVSLLLLRRGSQHSLNVKGAYLEVLGDLLGSLAVIAAALVITLAGWKYADPLASVLVALMILPPTWTLLREAVDVLLEATPKGMDLTKVRRHIMETAGVTEAHDLHVWTIT